MSVHQFAVEGNLKGLINLRLEGYDWTTQVSLVAAKHGHLHIIQHMYKHRLLLNTEVCVVAAANDHLPILRFWHEHGCEWVEQTSRAAVKRQQFECLQYCVENGCPMTEDCICIAVSLHRLDIVTYLDSKGCEWGTRAVLDSVLYNNAECFDFLVSTGKQFDTAIIWNQLSQTMINLSHYFTRMKMVQTLLAFHPLLPISKEFNNFVLGCKHLLTMSILDKEVWLRVYLFNNIEHIHQHMLPTLYMYKQRLNLLKEYALVEGDGLIPNHVIRYIVCEYL